MLIDRQSHQVRGIINPRYPLKPRYRLIFILKLIGKLPGKIACSLIRAYQYTGFLRRPSCRFYPSCSEYTHQCIAQHGVLKGIYAGALRIARCHPWNDGGVDEIPDSISLFNSTEVRNFER